MERCFLVTIIYEQKPIKSSILTCRETLSDEINFCFAYNSPFDANFSILENLYFFAVTFTYLFFRYDDRKEKMNNQKNDLPFLVSPLIAYRTLDTCVLPV